MVRTRRNWEHATTRVCEENTAVVQRRPSQAANGNEPARVEVCVAEEFQRRRPFVLSTVRKKRFERGWSGTQSSGRSECSAAHGAVHVQAQQIGGRVMGARGEDGGPVVRVGVARALRIEGG